MMHDEPERRLSDHPRVARAVMTCPACPEQYSGKLDDGRAFYFRLRHGRAYLGAGTDDAEASDDALMRPAVEYGDRYTGAFDSAADRSRVFGELLAQLDQPRRWVTRAEMGKAADRGAGPLLAITTDDEKQHPHWPAIDENAEPYRWCEHTRRQYYRTRCAMPRCGRCWAFGRYVTTMPEQQPGELMTFPCGASMRVVLPAGFDAGRGTDRLFSTWQEWHGSRCNCRANT